MSSKPKTLRAPSPYILFCNDKRSTVKQQHPNATFGETGKKLSEIWFKLSNEEKARYTQESARLKKKSC